MTDERRSATTPRRHGNAGAPPSAAALGLAGTEQKKVGIIEDIKILVKTPRVDVNVLFMMRGEIGEK
eukprot:3997683-Heterocapsa_arctica.AAC.1